LPDLGTDAGTPDEKPLRQEGFFKREPEGDRQVTKEI
jgi:hypothetical protein